MIANIIINTSIGLLKFKLLMKHWKFGRIVKDKPVDEGNA